MEALLWFVALCAAFSLVSIFAEPLVYFAKTLSGLATIAFWLARHVARRGRISHNLVEALIAVGEFFDGRIWRSHDLAKALGRIDEACAEQGGRMWWDFSVNCGGHDCRECYACRITACVRAGGHDFQETALLFDGCKLMKCRHCPEVEQRHLKVYGCRQPSAV